MHVVILAAGTVMQTLKRTANEAGPPDSAGGLQNSIVDEFTTKLLQLSDVLYPWLWGSPKSETTWPVYDTAVELIVGPNPEPTMVIMVLPEVLAIGAILVIRGAAQYNLGEWFLPNFIQSSIQPKVRWTSVATHLDRPPTYHCNNQATLHSPSKPRHLMKNRLSY
jgi:hypothetical protein